MKIVIFLIMILLFDITIEIKTKYIKYKKDRMNKILHKNFRKKHKKKRRLFGLGGPKYSEEPKWKMKDLNLTTEIPLVVADKKEQHPLFVVPQIISK